METPYFVMLNNQTGTRLLPLCDAVGDMLMFETKKEAEAAAEATLFGLNFGFEVHKAGGEDWCV